MKARLAFLHATYLWKGIVFIVKGKERGGSISHRRM